MTSIEIISIALAAGLFPALFLVWLWTKADKHPEPLRYIILAFVGGMASAPLVIPVQQLLMTTYEVNALTLVLPPVIAISLFHLLLASSEELFKYGAAWLSALSTPENNERIDPVIYMIVAALGFAAIENSLYIMTQLEYEGFRAAADTAYLRVIGPTMLHVISSATLGLFLAFSYYHPRRSMRRFYIPLGLLAATVLHAAFNIGIAVQTVFSVHAAFYTTWFGIITLIVVLEAMRSLPESQSAIYKAFSK